MSSGNIFYQGHPARVIADRCCGLIARQAEQSTGETMARIDAAFAKPGG